MFQLSHKVPGRDFEAGEKGKRRFRPWGGLLAVREGWRRKRRARATCGWWFEGSGWPVAVAPRRAAVLCRCNGIPARRGGDGRARELRWDESKRIWGLVEGGVGSSGGSAWRGGWQSWRAAALRKCRRAGLAGDEASSAAARHSCNAPWRGAGLRGGGPRCAVAEAGQTSGHGAHTKH